MIKELAVVGGSMTIGFLGGWLWKSRKVKNQVEHAKLISRQLQAVIKQNRNLKASCVVRDETIDRLQAEAGDMQGQLDRLSPQPQHG